MLPGRADFFQPYCVLETDWAIGRKKCESRKCLIHTFFLAEREGFEPPVQLPVHRISSAARSTTPASLLVLRGCFSAFPLPETFVLGLQI